MTHIADSKITVIHSNVNKLPEQSNYDFYLGLESFEFTLPAQPEEGILPRRKSVFTELHIIHNKLLEASLLKKKEVVSYFSNDHKCFS